jgi:hypothetical protein
MDQNKIKTENTAPEDVTEVLKAILNELKEINLSLKSLARSQAHLATVQKSITIKKSEG